MAPETRSAAPAGHAAARQANRRSIELMVAGMACFVGNDTLVKFVSETLPTGQLIFLRGLMATALILLVIRLTRTVVEPRRLMGGWVLGRAALDALGSVTFLVALFHQPIANATAINMAAPLLVTLLAARLLQERVGPRRWVVTCVGFAGVLLVIQPGASGFNAYAWLSLLGTLLIALRDTVVRFVPADMPTLAVTLSGAIVVTGAAGVISLFEGWQPVDARSLALLAAAAALLSTAYFLVVRSTRLGELSVVAPFRYTALPFATLLGWAVWGHVPNALAWAGMALVIGAGLYLLRHPRA